MSGGKEVTLEGQAVTEILKDVKRSRELAHDFGALAWNKSRQPLTNKRFLNNTLVSTLRHSYREDKKRKDGSSRKYKEHMEKRKFYNHPADEEEEAPSANIDYGEFDAAKYSETCTELYIRDSHRKHSRMSQNFVEKRHQGSSSDSEDSFTVEDKEAGSSESTNKHHYKRHASHWSETGYADGFAYGHPGRHRHHHNNHHHNHQPPWRNADPYMYDQPGGSGYWNTWDGGHQSEEQYPPRERNQDITRRHREMEFVSETDSDEDNYSDNGNGDEEIEPKETKQVEVEKDDKASFIEDDEEEDKESFIEEEVEEEEEEEVEEEKDRKKKHKKKKKDSKKNKGKKVRKIPLDGMSLIEKISQRSMYADIEEIRQGKKDDDKEEEVASGSRSDSKDYRQSAERVPKRMRDNSPKRSQRDTSDKKQKKSSKWKERDTSAYSDSASDAEEPVKYEYHNYQNRPYPKHFNNRFPRGRRPYQWNQPTRGYNRYRGRGGYQGHQMYPPMPLNPYYASFLMEQMKEFLMQHNGHRKRSRSDSRSGSSSRSRRSRRKRRQRSKYSRSNSRSRSHRDRSYSRDRSRSHSRSRSRSRKRHYSSDSDSSRSRKRHSSSDSERSHSRHSSKSRSRSRSHRHSRSRSKSYSSRSKSRSSSRSSSRRKSSSYSHKSRSDSRSEHKSSRSSKSHRSRSYSDRSRSRSHSSSKHKKSKSRKSSHKSSRSDRRSRRSSHSSFSDRNENHNKDTEGKNETSAAVNKDDSKEKEDGESSSKGVNAGHSSPSTTNNDVQGINGNAVNAKDGGKTPEPLNDCNRFDSSSEQEGSTDWSDKEQP